MENPGKPLWEFLRDGKGSFISKNPELTSRLYFPLMNEAGMRCSVTPDLKGDISAGFDKYLMPPVVTEDLHRTNNSRYFWISADGYPAWSINGLSPSQELNKWSEKKEESEIKGRPGSFSLSRFNPDLGIRANIKIFVPAALDKVELWKVSLTNTGGNNVKFNPFLALPMYGRHADNLRDHRQVTTMFQKTYRDEFGVRVKPTIVHDEHGHRVNTTSYFAYSYDESGNAPERIWTRMQDFIGEGGSLNNPEAIIKNLPEPDISESSRSGVEAVAAMAFSEITLLPGEETSFIFIAGVTDEDNIDFISSKYNTAEKFDEALKITEDYWADVVSEVKFETGRKDFDEWTLWLAFQLKCRQIFGNSFLPDFGYGRGGRGWRDLWQDLLSIFLISPETARDEIVNNLKGIRIDGSNATIIGNNPGEFKADRNNIPRTWCDHGAWPFFALNFYIQQTGDFDILFEKIPYWKDQHINRSTATDKEWNNEDGNWLKDAEGNIYQGTILEHVLIQQLSAFYNVGEHNILKLEGADWNDTLDMARNRGESVCFQNFYAGNLEIIVELLERLHAKGKIRIKFIKEIEILLDRISGHSPVDYNSPGEKNDVLNSYYQRLGSRISGETVEVETSDLILDLRSKASHSGAQIRSREWISTEAGYSYFNGHYDDLGRPMHGNYPEGPRMDLTSQVMPVMFNVADDEQIEKLFDAAQNILGDRNSRGLRLCTPYPDIDMNIGRITGFVYGYKEHGSKWMQQNIMFMYGLYSRGKSDLGRKMLDDIMEISMNSAVAKTFPGVASYYEPDDRGSYMYLTGSSTWLFLTLVTQIFGVRGAGGDLMIDPRIPDSFFDENGEIYIECSFSRRRIGIKYKRNGSDTANGGINRVIVGNETLFSGWAENFQIEKSFIGSNGDDLLIIEVSLG